jgi:ABC-2 type transport system ATP-binding protein
MSSKALQINSLSHSYGDNRALDNLTLELEAGKSLGLLGPNGGGKTTCFRLFSTLIPIEEGEATLLGLNLKLEPEKVRELIGVVFQAPSLDDKLTVYENLMHQGHLYGMLGRELKSRIESNLDRLGVLKRKKDLVSELSGGLKRRVEIAKGLLHKPKVLLLDEPSTGLDPVARIEMWSYLKTLQKGEGVSIIVTTHLMEEAEALDEIVILDRGKLVAQGTPLELKAGIGKKVLVIDGGGESLEKELTGTEGLKVSHRDGQLHVETNNAEDLMSRLLKEKGEEINSLMIRQPSLEDVFVHLTGHSFRESEEA